MSTALTVSALYAGFVAISGFLFGQLFVGHFSIVASVVGVAGITAAAGALMLANRSGHTPPWVQWSSLVALIGVIADAANYYLYLAIPGNYYAWGLIGPFAACLGFIGLTARRRSVKSDS